MATRQQSPPRATWWHYLAAALLCLTSALLMGEAWRTIYAKAAGNDEYSHIFLVPILAAWLIWVRRLRFQHLRVTGTILGPAIVLVGWACAYWGFNDAHESAFHLGAIMVAVGCVVAALGKQVLFRFFPAVLVLVFLVPVPDDWRQWLAQPLQQWTAHIAHFFLDMVRVDSVLSGDSLTINGEHVMVDEACNGMRLVFPLLLIAYAFAFALPLRPGVRWLVILVSPIVALACNVARTLPTIWLYGRAGDARGTDRYQIAFAAAQRFHDYSGWAMLPLSFVLLMGLLQLLRWMLVPVDRYTLAGQG